MDASVDVSNVILTGNRIFLRAWRREDLNQFYNIAQNKGLALSSGLGLTNSEDSAKRKLNNYVLSSKAFAIVKKNSNQIIGSIGLEPSEKRNIEELQFLIGRELSYYITTSSWNQGYCSEAIELVLSYAKESHWNFCTICAKRDNAVSNHVALKNGFVFYRYLPEIDANLYLFNF